jgi:Ca2+-binding EF-hand superfamily protein
MPNVYINKKQRNALWEAFSALDEIQSDCIYEEDVEKYKNAKELVLEIYNKAKQKQ